MKTFYLPASIKAEPLAKKIAHLEKLVPDDGVGNEMLVDYCLERYWRETFYAGPTGGEMLKSQALAKKGRTR